MAEAAKPKGERPAKRPNAPQPQGDPAHVCTVGFCPICLAVTAVQPMKPEAVEHLMNAGRELLLAMSAVLGTRAEQADRKEKAPTLTRIDIE